MKPPTYFSRSKALCRLSDPAQPPHRLSRHRSDVPFTDCFLCKGKQLCESKFYYYCATCKLKFHGICQIFPLDLKYPIHLSHPLTLLSSDPSFNASERPDIQTDSGSSSDSEAKPVFSIVVDDVEASPDKKNGKCKCCGRLLDQMGYYHCFICKVSFNMACAFSMLPSTILHQKSHEHALTIFPRRPPLPCDACGKSLQNSPENVYACLLCSYMVHGICIYLPRVIKITRHLHRLSFTASLSPGDFSCGVCRQIVDVNYGQYSCNKGCHYAVHAKCATREEIWDGKDLEGVSEAPSEDKDIEPFVKIDEETIQHFSHDHYLKFKDKDHISNGKFCEACCIRLTISDSLYSCMQCDFVLHEACASLPRKKHHPLHKHPLILNQYDSERQRLWSKLSCQGLFECNGCARRGCGFMYECEEGCRFLLDVRCAFLPDPLIHESHDHSLFFNLTKGECMRCKSTRCSSHYLECMECKIFMGLRCANLPSVAYYKHDRHPLTLCYGEKGTTNLQYWCELCESKLDASKWFYTCDYCGTTLHVSCLLGVNMYMKPNYIFKIDDDEVEIVYNEANSRPICGYCAHPRVDNLVYKWEGVYYCTLYCVATAIEKVTREVKAEFKRMKKAKQQVR